MLAVRDVAIELTTKRARREVVRGISFDVAAGELLGVVGQTGSGKSITLHAVMGLLPPGGRVVRGSIELHGRPLLGLSRRELRKIRGTEIGLIPQQPLAALNPIRPIERQFYNVLRSHEKISFEAARHRAAEMLDRVGISNPARVLASYALELSGGMAQRVAITIALSLRPKLILADEPTTALDVTIQREILDLMSGLCRDDGLAMVLVTHDLGVVANYTSSMVVLRQGVVVEQGPTDRVLSTPEAAYTRGLIESVEAGI